MGYWLCLQCFETFHGDRFMPNPTRKKMCPKAGCSGDLVEIDELMLEPIRILNQKEYYTAYCCSGHTYRDYGEMYIAFANGIKVNTAPEGWKLEGGHSIRHKFKEGISKTEKLKDICKHISTLVDWAEGLEHFYF